MDGGHQESLLDGLSSGVRNGRKLARKMMIFVCLMLLGYMLFEPVPSSFQQEQNLVVTCNKEIWVIRHGEKPNVKVDKGLSPVGKQRAQFLGEVCHNGTWPRFVGLFASSATKKPFIRREIETILPISRELGVPINDHFGQFDDYEDLAREVFSALDEDNRSRLSAQQYCPDGVRAILIAWEHCQVPGLLRALGCEQDRCSRCWSDNNFNSVIRFRVHSEHNRTKLIWQHADQIAFRNPHRGELSVWNGGFPPEYGCARRHYPQNSSLWNNFRCIYPNGTMLHP